jgi:diguanylate cyclase (GGDEF)-like protein/PAS domain S-box-containing protein
MSSPGRPANEIARIRALRDCHILDTGADPAYDAYARLAAEICGTPMAAVTLVDSTRQWMKVNIGLSGSETMLREKSFCAYAILSPDITEVPDALADERFAENPIVTGAPNVRFYAGFPLVDSEGHALGALCVLDTEARTLTDEQRAALQRIGESLIWLIENRRLQWPADLDRAELLNSALEYSAEPVLVCDVPEDFENRARIVYANRAFTETFEYTLPEMIGHSPSFLLGPKSDREAFERLRVGSRLPEHQTESVLLYTRSGTPLHVEFRDRSIDAHHRIIVLRDMTSFYIAQDVLANATALLAKQAKRTHALYLISATSEMNESSQIEAALALVLKTLDMDFGYVGALENEKLQIRYASGDSAMHVGATVELDRPVLRSGFVTPDVAMDVVMFDDLCDQHGVLDEPDYPVWRGYIAAHLRVQEAPYGAIGFVSRRAMRFDDSDRDFIRMVAVLISTILERAINRERLNHLAFHDVLTGLTNRAKFMEDLKAAVSRGSRHRRWFAVHYIDLDDFKAINDRGGHTVGDLALQEAAERLRQVARISDIPARLGGDEFVLLQSDIAKSEDATVLGRRIVEAFSVPFVVNGEAFDLGASVGVAIYPDDGIEARDLLKNADAALYRAKAKGKRRLELGRA